jgi:hypothetical protein
MPRDSSLFDFREERNASFPGGPILLGSAAMSVSDESQPLKYTMLGEDTASTQDKLGKYLGEVNWSYLRPHFERDCLYFVDASLEMTAVGAAMAEDDSEAVQGWLKIGDLVKIEALHARQWDETDRLFEALVVSPFVLCRLL